MSPMEVFAAQDAFVVVEVREQVEPWADTNIEPGRRELEYTLMPGPAHLHRGGGRVDLEIPDHLLQVAAVAAGGIGYPALIGPLPKFPARGLVPVGGSP